MIFQKILKILKYMMNTNSYLTCLFCSIFILNLFEISNANDNHTVIIRSNSINKDVHIEVTEDFNYISHIFEKYPMNKGNINIRSKEFDRIIQFGKFKLNSLDISVIVISSISMSILLGAIIYYCKMNTRKEKRIN